MLGDLNEDEQQAIIKEEKSRERNRDHSRKSRLRKKEFVESLKHDVNQLQIYQQICEQCCDLIALVSQDAIFMYSSAAYSRVLGYQGHQIVAGQTSFLDLVHPVSCCLFVVASLLCCCCCQQTNMLLLLFACLLVETGKCPGSAQRVSKVYGSERDAQVYVELFYTFVLSCSIRGLSDKLRVLSKCAVQFRIKSVEGEYFRAETAACMTDKGVVCSTRVDRDI